MPCFLFTWHAYGTWMPDRKQGYVKKGRGVLPPDPEEAARYRARQKETSASFDEAVQLLVIEEAIVTAEKRGFRLHAVAIESTHVHVLMSWADDRTYQQLRRGLRESISRRLNAHLRRRWLEQCSSSKQVKDRKHFDYLMDEYLPSHSGWKWTVGKGLYR